MAARCAFMPATRAARILSTLVSFAAVLTTGAVMLA